MDFILPFLLAGGIHLLSWFGEPVLSPLYSILHLGTIVEPIQQLLSFHWLVGLKASEGRRVDAPTSMFYAGGTKYAAALDTLSRSTSPYCMLDFWSQPACVATYDDFVYSETGHILSNTSSTALHLYSHSLLGNSLFAATLLSTLSLYVFVTAIAMVALSLAFSLVFSPRFYPKFMDWAAVGALVWVKHGWEATAVVFYTEILSGLGVYKMLFGDVSAEDELEGVNLLPGAFMDLCAFLVVDNL